MMLFGVVCRCGRPNNPALFQALGAVRAEGVKVDSLDYIFFKTPADDDVEKILATLSLFHLRPIRVSCDAPELLNARTCTRAHRQAFFRHIKLNRARYLRGLETTYWYWLQAPLDTQGHPLPPPVGAYEIDATPSSRWKEYWDRCPSGEHCTRAILD